jgi:tRNA A37 threonylcarbamoyladenosine synthetase subunit TsaC/SUA5/YrdC
MTQLRFLDPAADAARAMVAIEAGGIAIMPMDIGYSLIGAAPTALTRIFATKGRSSAKLNAMLGNDAMAREVYALSRRGRDVIDAITKDYDLPLGAVAPFRADHPMMARVDADTLARSTKDGTLLMLLNAGHFHAAITRLSLERARALFGSSANRSLAGTKFRAADIEPEITAIADVVIDYGLVKYHPWRASSTILNVETLEVVRFGALYENIAAIVARWFGVELPPRPGV